MNNPVLLAVAPNGAYKSKREHPALPLTTDEIASDAKACMKSGARMLHLHIRDTDFKHSLSVSRYKKTISKVRHKTDDGLLVQVTSEAGGSYRPAEQFAMIEKLKPQAVSIALREIASLDDKTLNLHFNNMRKHNTWPQIILYNQHDLEQYYSYQQRAVIPGAGLPILLVIGKMQAEGAFNMEILTDNRLQDFPSWMVCAFGMEEHQAAIVASHNAGHVRIGFENNTKLLDGSAAKNNAELVAQTATSMFLAKRKLADLTEAMNIMRPDW